MQMFSDNVVLFAFTYELALWQDHIRKYHTLTTITPYKFQTFEITIP